MVHFDMVDMDAEDSRTNTTPKMSDHCASCVKKLAAEDVDLGTSLRGALLNYEHCTNCREHLAMDLGSSEEEVEEDGVKQMRTCISCKALWPLSEKHFQKKGNRYGSYFAKTCKACNPPKGKKKRRRRPVDTAEDKPAEDMPAAAPKHPLEEPLKPFPALPQGHQQPHPRTRGRAARYH